VCSQSRCQLILKQELHVAVYVAAVWEHIVERRASEQASERSWLSWSRCFVVRIEEIRIPFVQCLVTRKIWLEKKGLEKPGRVRKMPLGWARVGHGLHNCILSTQVFDGPFAPGTCF
jgi:hypothetical protein